MIPARLFGAAAAAAMIAACSGPEPVANEQRAEAPAAGEARDSAESDVDQPANEDRAEPPTPSEPAPSDDISACLVQDGERLSVLPLRAIGTEPFWGADIKGRCVTYSHPENIEGTRVWTQYSPLPNGGGTWSGALNGQKFELTMRREGGCSDGMSDKRYPFAVDLLVGGEQRRGCAQRKAE